jgi:trk system potassium uptake protein TrkH
MSDLRPVFFVIGLMSAALGILMFIPMIVDYYHEARAWRAFAIAGGMTTLFGTLLATITYSPNPSLRSRGAFVLTVFAWLTLSILASFPFLFEPINLSVTDALFEATSGITTTGSTILTGLDNMPKVGGMQLFRLESSDMGEKILPRAASLAGGISLIYLGLTIACFAGYMITGMNWFDATAHAMTTLATGGYSTSDASMGGFMDNGADIVCVAFMLAGGMPFGVYLLMTTRGDWRAPLRDSQVRAFLTVIVALIAIVTLFLVLSDQFEFSRGLRLAAFNTVSVVTGTGYATTDYNAWGPFAVAAFFAFMFIGGCAGSTACSIKIFRYQVAFEAMRNYLFRMPREHAVVPMRYGGRTLPPGVVYSVMSYFFVFFLTFVVTAILLSLIGLDPITAWSGAGSAVANVGPGLGEIIGPAGTYQDLPGTAKWVLLTAMIIGRLEIVTALVLLTPAFWRS